MTATLRGRLAAWYLVSVGVIVVLLLVAVGGLFWVTLQDQIDHHVLIAVNEAQQKPSQRSRYDCSSAFT